MSVGASFTGPVYLGNQMFQMPKLETHTSFCHWAAPEYSTIGQTALHAILSVIAFAVGVWSAAEQMRIFKLRYEIAKGYANIAQEEWDRFNQKYRPLENAQIAENLTTPVVTANYPKAKSDYTQFVELSFGQAQKEFDTLAKKYCLCPNADLETEKNIFLDDSVNFGYRSEERMIIEEEDQRFNIQASLLNIGRNNLANASKFSGLAADLLGHAAQANQAATNGAFGFLGYVRNRFATSYPAHVMQSSSAGVAMTPTNNQQATTPHTFE
ncbi:MAG: hypothetical protein LBS60_08890 [Deltaproteobacteria bacterium]|jgi:hypothetical protein|nr:hypothetical protein [Deltaproteobacteria bacterium]